MDHRSERIFRHLPTLLLVSFAIPLLGQAPQAIPPTEPLIIAHRGDSQARPENTLAAIRSAVAVKADWIEFDVRSINNGALYLLHDDNLERFKRGKRKVQTLTDSDVAKLDVGTWFNPEYAAERAPTLADALRACLDGKTVPLIERKTGTPTAYLKVIRELKAEKKVVLQSFDWAFLAEIRKLEPSIRIGALHGKDMAEIHWQKLRELQPEWVGWKDEKLSQALIARFHKEGFKVAVWTVNKESEIKKFAAHGVDAIITDRPKVARELLAESEEVEGAKK